MVTYKEIIEAIDAKIRIEFPLIKRQAYDNEKGLKRPSFRVTLDDIRTSSFMNVAKDRNMTARIYYFPSSSEKYRLEILGIQDQLESAFIEDNIITTKGGFIIEIYEFQFDVVDGVLHFYFDIQLSEDLNKTDDRELMEDVNLEQNIK